MSKEQTQMTEPENITPSPLSTEGKVGSMLRDVRIKKKIELEKVAKDLYIKATYLSAIENSDYDNIPEHPYGIGFVRSYASYLGLNSSRIVQIFKEETEGSSPIPTPNKTTDNNEEIVITNSNKKYLVISLLMIICGYALWTSFTDNNEVTEPETSTIVEINENTYTLPSDETEDNNELILETPALTEEPQQITVTNDEFNEATLSPENKTDTNLSQEPTVEETTVNTATTINKKNSRVIFKVKKETWIEVKDSNTLWISKVLQAGSEYAVPENGENKTVSFGNTDGVDVVIDGKIVTITSPNKKTNINLNDFLNNNH